MTITRRALVVPGLLLALGFVPVVAGVARLAHLAGGEPAAESARFFASPLPVTLHILAVIPYALLGALQFVPALRRGRWHRTVGMLLVPLGLLAALTGLWMTLVYPWPESDGEALYLLRLVVGSAMTMAILQGVLAVRRHDYTVHAAWMTRAYALGMGAGTQVFTHLPWFVLVGTPGETSRFVLMALGWLINAAVAEYFIGRGLVRRGSRATSFPAGSPRL